jgi:hypothetical protein
MERISGEYLPVSKLLNNITRSSDYSGDQFDWVRLIDDFLEEDFVKMESLLESISRRGFLAEGGINVYHEGEEYCTCKDCGNTNELKSGWKLANGHHRFAAALLLGLEEIPVVFDRVHWPDHLWER